MSDEKKSYGIAYYWEQFFKREWSYTTGAVLLSVIATILVVVTEKPWGVTSAFSTWGGVFLTHIGVDADSWAVFNGKLENYSVLKDQTGLLDVTIILGAFLATLLAASFKFKKIKNIKQVFAAIIGGTLMGVGARVALGCNIGAMFSAVPAFSLHGWVFVVAIFIGASLGGVALRKWFM